MGWVNEVLENVMASETESRRYGAMMDLAGFFGIEIIDQVLGSVMANHRHFAPNSDIATANEDRHTDWVSLETEPVMEGIELPVVEGIEAEGTELVQNEAIAASDILTRLLNENAEIRQSRRRYLLEQQQQQFRMEHHRQLLNAIQQDRIGPPPHGTVQFCITISTA